MIVPNAYDRVHGDVFQSLLLRLFGAHEFNQSVNAALIAVVHAVNLVHHNDNSFRFFLKHGKHAVFAHVVIGYQVNDGLVAYVARIVFHHVIV